MKATHILRIFIHGIFNQAQREEKQLSHTNNTRSIMDYASTVCVLNHSTIYYNRLQITKNIKDLTLVSSHAVNRSHPYCTWSTKQSQYKKIKWNKWKTVWALERKTKTGKLCFQGALTSIVSATTCMIAEKQTETRTVLYNTTISLT